MRADIYQMVTDQIINQLEQVNPNDYNTPWFCVGHSPINLRGTAYRGINHVLLSNSGFASNIWGTFKQWSEQDCKIIKGEKSRIVVLWKFFDKAEDENETTSNSKAVMTRYFRVFNSEQIDGSFARTIEQKFKDKLKSHDPIAEAEGFIADYLKAENLSVRPSDRAFYAGGIQEHFGMPELGQFQSPLHYYSVFAHEITHSTGHSKRLNRDMLGRFGDKSYAFEELVAELGSAMICGALGLEPKPRPDHAQYIKGWLSALRGDNSFVISAASHAQRAADYALQYSLALEAPQQAAE